MMALEVLHDSGVCTDKNPVPRILPLDIHKAPGCWDTANGKPSASLWGLLAEKAKAAEVQPLPPFLLPVSSCMHGCAVAQLCLTLAALWTAATRFLYPWDFPGKDAGVGCHFLLQGTFPTQELNLCLLHCRWILYHCATWEAPLLA